MRALGALYLVEGGTCIEWAVTFEPGQLAIVRQWEATVSARDGETTAVG